MLHGTPRPYCRSASALTWTKRSCSCLDARAEAEDQLPGAEPVLRGMREWIQSARWLSSTFSTSAELVKVSFSIAVSSVQMSLTTAAMVEIEEQRGP